MRNKMLGGLVATVTALSLVGIARAATPSEGPQTTEITTVTVPEVETTALPAAATTTPELENEIEVENHLRNETEVEDHEAAASSTVEVAEEDHTPSTLPDGDEDEDHTAVADTSVIQDIPEVGTVSVDLVDGSLVLVSASAPGWSIEVEEMTPDEIVVRFRQGENEAKFKADLEDGAIDIEVELGADD